MMLLDPGLGAAVAMAGFALLSATLIILVLKSWTGEGSVWPTYRRGRTAPQDNGRAVFLFEGEELIDATPAARRLLHGVDTRGSDLDTLLSLLGRRFGPDLETRLRALAAPGRLRLREALGPGGLDAEALDGGLRLALDLPVEGQALDADGAQGLDRLRLEAALEELGTLRALAHDAPQLIWSLDGTGALTWANRAYLTMIDLARVDLTRLGDASAEAEPPIWPTTPLFEAPAGLREGQVETRRLALTLPGSENPQWFDVTSVRRGMGSIHFATDAGGLVQAEAARHHFVQTLTKTFAHLATGLAILDRQRRLVLFNPAFVDMTGLPIPFLSTRPPVHSVLDRLRDAKILPEPRNYATWRDEVAALEAAAAQEHYCETWCLPGGQTWRVTGRPHPDGALAFLFEDISDAIALTRRFRTELSTSQAVLDSLEDAVAAFSSTGVLSLCNAAYSTLWGSPAANLSEPDVLSELQRWRGLCAPSSVWTRLRDGPFMGGRVPVTADLYLASGTALHIRATPLAGGGTLVTFGAPRQPGAEHHIRAGHGPIEEEPPTWGPSPPVAAPSSFETGCYLSRSEPYPEASNPAVDGCVGDEPEMMASAANEPRSVLPTDRLAFATRRSASVNGGKASGLLELRARFGVRS